MSYLPFTVITAGSRSVEGRYVAERRRNPLVQTHLGGRILSAAMLPWFTIRTPKGCGVLSDEEGAQDALLGRILALIFRGLRAEVETDSPPAGGNEA